MFVARKVLATIKKYNMIKSGEKVLLAVSGGPDSMALMHILLDLREELGIDLHVFHLNHCFRGEESDRDARLVRETAKDFGLPCSMEEYDVPGYCARTKKSSQEGAREIRYRLISRVSARVGAARVALGHHADDQAETIVLNFIRGSGLTGLKGFLPVRDDFYIRPLFELRRQEIENYCHDRQISFRVDSSNQKSVYKRNRVRLKLMPVLTDYNPSLVSALTRTAEVLRDEDRFLEEAASEAYDRVTYADGDGVLSLDVDLLEDLPVALQRRVLRKLWNVIAGRETGPAFGHLENILDLLREGRGTWVCHLPGNVQAVRKYGCLQLKRGSVPLRSIPSYCYRLVVPGEVFIPETGAIIRAQPVERGQAYDPAVLPPEEVLLDLEKLPGILAVRRRLPGDRFSPLGMNGARVKLKKFLIDQKIPREERDRIPLVECAGEIAWVAGIRPGEKFKVTEDSNRLLHLSWFPGEDSKV